MLNVAGYIAHDLAINTQQVVPTHARLPGNAGSHNADIRAGNISVVRCPYDVGVIALDGPGFEHIQSLSLGQAINHVEQNDIAKSFEHTQVGKGTADITCANECDFLPSHNILPSGLASMKDIERYRKRTVRTAVLISIR